MRLTGHYTTDTKLVDNLEGGEEIILAAPAGTTEEGFRNLVLQGQYHMDMDHRLWPERFGMTESSVAQLFTAELDDEPHFDGALATLNLTARVPRQHPTPTRSAFFTPSDTTPLSFAAAVLAFCEVQVVHRVKAMGL